MAVMREEVEAGAAVLARRDRVLRQARKRYGPPDLHRARPRTSHFAQLARMICYQQLHGNAARTIHGRFAALYGGRPTAAAVVATSDAALRSVGLSRAKAASIRDLAEHVVAGELPLARIGRLDDDAVVEALVAVRGIGPWTAEMFLMFQLGRLDVWPVGDYGVRKGFARLYDQPEMLDPTALRAAGERFRPYRSLVAWYCWRAADTALPEPT